MKLTLILLLISLVLLLISLVSLLISLAYIFIKEDHKHSLFIMKYWITETNGSFTSLSAKNPKKKTLRKWW